MPVGREELLDLPVAGQRDLVEPLFAVRLERRLDPLCVGAEDPVHAAGEVTDVADALRSSALGLARQAVEEAARRA